MYEELLGKLRSFGCVDSYVVFPASAIPQGHALHYWQELERADTLKFRWSDIAEPNAYKCASVSLRQEFQYFVIDVDNAHIVAEFSLGPFTGKAAQVHFSMTPANSSELNYYLAEAVTDMVLTSWHNVCDLDSYFVDTIFGITPVDNRIACIFIRKVGFRPIGYLPSGSKYLNKTCDGLLTVKTRTN